MRVESRYIGTKEKLKKGNLHEKSQTGFFETMRDIENDTEIEFDSENVNQEDLKNLAGLIEQIGESLSGNPAQRTLTAIKNI